MSDMATLWCNTPLDECTDEQIADCAKTVLWNRDIYVPMTLRAHEELWGELKARFSFDQIQAMAGLK